MKRYTFNEFNKQFPDDAACLEWLFNRFYPEGTVECKNCGRATKHHRVKSRPSYSCDVCGNHVHPTAGTIFHKSSTSLRLWFYAIYLVSSTRSGISAKHLERELGVTYKTAWRMMKQIRAMMDTGDDMLSNEVEMDDIQFGPKPIRDSRLHKPSKQTVTGAVERGTGRVIARQVPGAQLEATRAFVRAYIVPGSIVHTDGSTDVPQYPQNRV